ncbi:RGCVC family protein [Pseudonocardia yunnanensis]|uniref:RGCVC family protein n=1 Tax=Pseudonocardia yunnanensis TaxID=58107 RepID=A0ABW4F122_9PSEU
MGSARWPYGEPPPGRPTSRPSASAVRRMGGVESISHVGGQARVVLDSGPHWTNLPSGDGSTDITSASDTQSTTAPTDLDETEVACPVCPHPRDAHDAIGTRYCTATIASGAAGRGCVCRLPG